MARREIVVLQDDIDGSENATVKTREFGFNGTSYEIDLTDKNYERLAKVLSEFVDAARVQSKLRSVKGGGARSSGAQRQRDNEAMRKGLKALGWPVKERGRIPAKLQMAFHAGERWYVDPNPAKPTVKKAVPPATFKTDLVEQAAAKDAVVPAQKTAAKKAPAKRASRVKAEAAA